MTIRKVLKFVGKILIFTIALFLIYGIATFILPRISIDEEANALDEITIYIKTNGVHTDIVVPTKSAQYDWSQDALFSNTTSKDTTYKYLAIGWGDRGFYLETPTWAELKPSVAFKAATGLSTSVIHATYYSSIQINEDCRQIGISKNQYARLIDYINNSAQKTQNGRWIYVETEANYDNRDAFYEAKGSYSLFNTCNTWANNGLKFSGQKHCFWTPFDTGIFLNY